MHQLEENAPQPISGQAPKHRMITAVTSVIKAKGDRSAPMQISILSQGAPQWPNEDLSPGSSVQKRSLKMR
jgi:hypothetical protein